MADLVRVQFTGGGEGKVSREWVERWPEDIAAVLDDAEPTTLPADITIPPLSGKGSGADAWRAYGLAAAEAQGLTLAISADAGRDDIVALLTDAGIATSESEATEASDTSTSAPKEATL